MQEELVRTILTVMLPLRESTAQTLAFETAKRLLAVGTNEATARVAIKDVLRSIGYRPSPEVRGTMQDLSSDERLDLVLHTSVQIPQGYLNWLQGNEEAALVVFPCQELVCLESRNEPRDWPARWRAAGGSLYGGRMIARKDDDIWRKISAFGIPFPPFDLDSGMGVRDIGIEEAVQLGVLGRADEVHPTKFNSGGQFTHRFASVLGQRLFALEDGERKRRADPLSFGTGLELLELAQERAAEADLSPEAIAEIRAFVEKAVERGFGGGPEWPADVYRSLGSIYLGINERERGISYQQKASELEVAFLLGRGTSYDLINGAEQMLASATELTAEATKQIISLIQRAFEQGFGENNHLRAKAHKFLAEAYDRTQEPEQAAANRVQYGEWADGLMLLRDAQAQVAKLGNKIEPEVGAPVLDLLTKAVQRLAPDCPKLHAEAYRATAEIFEALGDNPHAVEYYECALQLDPTIVVKRRLAGLRKRLGAS